MVEEVVKRINEADMVLVGLGEELDQWRKIKESDKYAGLIDAWNGSWIIPYVEKLMLEEVREEQIKMYQPLANILNGKNYFLVSLCQDGFIRQAGLKEERIVEPCGGCQRLQCSAGCSAELYDVSEELLEQISRAVREKNNEAEWKEPEWKEPVCPVCGKPLVFNNIEAENYVEEGYMAQWTLYKKWIQGTVNKKLCVLEIGVGMKYPTVIRWPFEKIVFFNQKAELFRIHSRLYQMTEEIKDRGHGICRKPEDFISELSNVI